jgi:quercetin dioxygenase-like cupin family protein
LNHIMDKSMFNGGGFMIDGLIQESLREYKCIIDSQKPDNLSVSTYRVEKPWGHEIWLELNEFYVYKLIHMTQGNRSSLQSHEFKYETNYVIHGQAEVLLENDNGVLESRVYGVGDGWSVPLGRKHRVIARTNYTALEVSTPHLNDVIRHQDDSDRPSGKINDEHQL